VPAQLDPEPKVLRQADDCNRILKNDQFENGPARSICRQCESYARHLFGLAAQ